MIKSALKIYRKNIWDVFAIIGFISIGVLIGMFVVLPSITTLTTTTVDKIASKATDLTTIGFNTNTFIKVLGERIKGLNWADPIRTIKKLFENNGLFNIVYEALKASCKEPGKITKELLNAIVTDCNYFLNGLSTQIYILITCVGIASIIGYVGTKIVVQIRSTADKHIGRFVLSFFINLAILAVVYYFVLLSMINNIFGVGLFFIVLGLFIGMLLLTLVTSIALYKKKETKFFELFNVKNGLYLLLSTLISYGISFVIIIIVFIISDIIGLLISLPLLIITTIIVENIVIAYVTNYNATLNSTTEAVK